MTENFHIVMTWLSLVLLASSLLCKISSTFQYYVKMIFLYISFTTTGTLLIPYGLWCYKTPWKASRLSADIIEPANQILGITYTMKGTENIDKKKAYVVVCNHQSSLDVLATMQYAGTFGFGIKLCGTVFVDRASSEAGRAAVNAAGMRAKELGTSLWIFPEGTRNHTDQMLPFKKGAFHVAVDSGLPILPVVFSEYSFLDNKRKFFGQGNISIEILEPIPTEGFVNSKENLNELIDTTRSKMMEAQKAMQEGNNNKKSN